MFTMKTIVVLLSSLFLFVVTLGVIGYAQTPQPKAAPAAPAPAQKSAATPAPTSKPTNLTMYTSQFGRSSYIQGFALAENLNKHSTWLRGTAEETMGSSDNVKLGGNSPEAKKNSLMVVSETPYKLARDGKKPFDKPNKDLKIVCVGFRAAHFFGTLDPKVKTFQDMIGKKVAVGPKTDPHGIKGTDQLKYCYEILDKVKIINMPAPDIGDALIDGIVNVGLLTANPGYPKWSKDETLEVLSARHKVYPIQLTLEQLKKSVGKAETVFTPIAIPADFLFPGQTSTLASVSFIYWTAYTDLPDEVVYEVLRMFYEFQPQFVEHHALMKSIIPNQLGEGDFTKEDVHSGALKFFKDKGLKVGL